jgi:hypothetical protein
VLYKRDQTRGTALPGICKPVDIGSDFLDTGDRANLILGSIEFGCVPSTDRRETRNGGAESSEPDKSVDSVQCGSGRSLIG